MSYDRLAPTISSKAKKLFGSGNMGQNNGGSGALSDGLDTRPGKILYPRLDLTKTRTRQGLNSSSTATIFYSCWTITNLYAIASTLRPVSICHLYTRSRIREQIYPI